MRHILLAALACTLLAVEPTSADRVGPDGVLYPDFTRAGVPGGIPAVPVAVRAADFGAAPGDDRDDAAAIQAAIDAAVAAGGGAVQLEAGEFIIDRTLSIQADGVVLRGAGRERTRLIPRFTGQDVSQTGNSKAVIHITAPTAKRRYDVWPDQPVRRGDTVLHLPAKEASQIKVGDLLTFTATPPAEAIAILSPELKKQAGDGSYGSIYAWQYLRVTAVDGSAITVDRPLRLDVALAQKPKLMHVPAMVAGCGVEHLAIVQTIASQGINGIVMNGARGCWIAGVAIQRIGNWPLGVDRSWEFTIRDCDFDESRSRGGAVAYIGFGFACDGLIETSRFTRLRHLSISMASNGLVFRDCTLANIDINFHLNWPYEVLFDGCRVDSGAAAGDELRGSYGNGIYTPSLDGGMHAPAGPHLTFYGNDMASPTDAIMLGGGATRSTIIAYNRFRVREGFAAVIRPGSDGSIIRGNLFVLHDPDRRKDWMMRGHYGHPDPESVRGVFFLPLGVPAGLEVIDNTIRLPRARPLFAGGEPAVTRGNRIIAATSDPEPAHLALTGEWKVQAVDLRPAAATPDRAHADPGVSEAAQRLLAADAADTSWPVVTQPALLASDPVDLGRLDGEVVLRRRFDLPEAMRGQPLTLALGTIDDHDETWVNGQKVGATTGPGSHRVLRRYQVPAELLKPTGNVVAVRVWDAFGGGGLGGPQRELWIGPTPPVITVDEGAMPTAPVPSLYAWQMERVGR